MLKVALLPPLICNSKQLWQNPCDPAALFMAIPTNHPFLHSLPLARSERSNYLPPSPSMSRFHFHQNLSTLTQADTTRSANAQSLHPNPFAEYATTEFNLSSADIAGIFKHNPSLGRNKTLTKVEQFVDMLKRHGCTQHQIAFIMKRQPRCLNICPETVLEPKILLLRDLGIHGEDLAKVVSRAPNILAASLQHTLIPNAAFLRDIFQTQDFFIKAILRKPSILTYDLEKYLKPSVAFFGECGLVGLQLCKFLLLRPGLLLCTCLTPAKADFLQKIGIDKASKMYKHVLTVVIVCRLETLESKMHNLVRCGITGEEAMELIRIYPPAFCFAQERVRQHMEFIVNDMELPANSVLKRPYLLTKNLKVLKPRVLVLKRIQTLNNLGHLYVRGLSSILAMSEAKFANKFIKGHPESRLLNEVYQQALTDASATTKADIKSSLTTWSH